MHLVEVLLLKCQQEVFLVLAIVCQGVEQGVTFSIRQLDIERGVTAAQALVADGRRRFGELYPLRWRIVKGCNRGSRVTTGPLVESLRSAR